MRISGSIPMVVAAAVIICINAPVLPTGTASAGELDHSRWDDVLQKYTENGLVEYATLEKDTSELDAYLAMLTKASDSDYESWSREERMAFWINAYNAVTIHGILLNYPIQPGGFFARRRFPQSSIRQIKDFWDTEFIELAGRPVTLDGIEHEILRREFSDPRIHFSIVCASAGCPVLSGSAYTAEGLNEMLSRDAIRFIVDPEKVRLDRENNVLYVSEIFKWYKDDFYEWEKSAWEEFAGDKERSTNDQERKRGHEPKKAPESDKHSVPAWLKRYSRSSRGFVKFIVDYASSDISEYIVDRSPELKYIEYDWTLNEKFTDQ